MSQEPGDGKPVETGAAGDTGAGASPEISPLTGRPATVRPPVVVMPSTSGVTPVSQSKGRGFLIGASIVAAILLAVWGAWHGLLALAEWGVTKAPTEWDRDLGEMAKAEIERGASMCSDERLQSWVDDMKDALLAEVKHSPFEFEFKVVKSDQVNAFALPGGFVYINTALLERADDSSEVAGVLGHEINHALLRHGMKRISRQLALGIVLNLFLGGAGMNAEMAGVAANLGELSFGRDEETEADVRGLPIAAAAGFDPEGAIRFFKKLAEEETGMGAAGKALMKYASTHPLTEDRIADIRSVIKKADLEPNPEHEDRTKRMDEDLSDLVRDIDSRCDD